MIPRGPKGEKRPADVIGAAVMVGRIATGEIEEGAGAPPDDGKDPLRLRLVGRAARRGRGESHNYFAADATYTTGAELFVDGDCSL